MLKFLYKFYYHFLKFIIIPIFFLCSLLCLLYFGYLNFSLENVLNFALKPIQLSGVEIYKSNLKIKKIFSSLDNDNIKINIHDINLFCDWSNGICKQDAQSKLFLECRNETIQADFSIEFNLFTRELKTTTNLADDSYIQAVFSNSDNKQILSIRSIKIPIKVAKLLLSLGWKKDASDYLSQAFVQGLIDECNLTYDITNKNFDDATGEVTISDLAFNYNPSLPMIRDAKIIGTLKEKELILRFQGGMIGGNKIKEANVRATTDDVIVINASLNGTIQSLLEFAPIDVLEVLKKNNFVFSKLQGKSESNIHITIPILSQDECDKRQQSKAMHIQVQANNTSCSCDFLGLKSQIITAPQLSFIYQLDDSHNEILLESNFLLNERASYIKYHYYFNNNTPTTSVVLAKIPLIESYLNNWASLEGNTHLVIEHTTFADGKSRTRMQTDLTPIELTIPILGIKKEAKIPMYLSVVDEESNGIHVTKGKIQNNDKIYANFQIDSKNASITRISIPHFGYDAMFFNAAIENSNGDKNIMITAKSLDFSRVDFKDILRRIKNDHHGNDAINIRAEQVLINNNVTLNDVELSYNKNEQNYLNFYGLLGGYYKVGIKHDPLTKKVNARCEDLGMFLKGFGLYQKLFRGVVAITYDYANNTKPLGKAHISSFYVTENNFLTSIVSLTSLSGLMNIITRTKQIIFEKGESEFEYKNDRLIIKNSLFSGPYMNLTAQGYIDRKEIMIKGNVVSEMYFTKTITEKIPGLNKLLGSIAPYRFQYSLDQ